MSIERVIVGFILCVVIGYFIRELVGIQRKLNRISDKKKILAEQRKIMKRALIDAADTLFKDLEKVAKVREKEVDWAVKIGSTRPAVGKEKLN